MMTTLIAATTGLVAGLVHVWSGPDHLAAIAPLAAPRSKRRWVLGARWGLGHSAGVAVIGLLSWWLRDVLPLNRLSSVGERLVGVMLIGVGAWALRKALRVHVHEHEHGGERHVHIHAHAAHKTHDMDAHQHHTHAAFGIGILHGLAGSSHLFGVLPILAFPTPSQALAYLGAFSAGTVASMAGFSWMIGWLGARCAAGSALAYRRLMSTCAVAAMAVGCFWLVR